MLYELINNKTMNQRDCAKMQDSVFGGSLSFFFNGIVFDFVKAD